MVTAILSDFETRDFEQLVLCHDPEAGLRSVIAVHDTTLGPSLGGVRMRAYPTQADAIRDAMNLAQAMTYKSALAGLNLGGGKSVINAPATSPNRTALLTRHAQYIASLGGRYIPGADMGTTARDMDLLAQWVPKVSSRRDPSRFTALGVLRSIEAAQTWAGESRSLAGQRVAVQGLGKVGLHLVELLRAEGAEVLAADVDPDRVTRAQRAYGATAVPVEDILGADVDIVCPCAAGGVVTEPVVDALKARMVIPAANNALASESLADFLAARGIVHVPDFVANAGGVISCEAEVRGNDDELDAKIDAIGDTTTAILREASERGLDVVTVANELAIRRLESRRRQRPHFSR
ncbi:MAG TPA: Glu/Leu/Phe/Val dehydrogenase dimerization domain-containing protein [Pseudonocardia sp.]